MLEWSWHFHASLAPSAAESSPATSMALSQLQIVHDTLAALPEGGLGPALRPVPPPQPERALLPCTSRHGTGNLHADILPRCF